MTVCADTSSRCMRVPAGSSPSRSVFRYVKQILSPYPLRSDQVRTRRSDVVDDQGPTKAMPPALHMHNDADAEALKAGVKWAVYKKHCPSYWAEEPFLGRITMTNTWRPFPVTHKGVLYDVNKGSNLTGILATSLPAGHPGWSAV
jgi:hypothetical protein